MNFKLLAIRPLDGCIKSVLNILKPDTIYYFDDAYEYDKEKQYLIKKEDFTELPNDFFYKKENEDSSLSYVNIQAIVGKNGSGKSSIVELLIRILNNFFKQYRLSEVTDNLIYSKGVKAELFYLRDNNIFKIYVDSTNLVDFKFVKDNLFKERIIDIKFYDSPNSCVTALNNHLTAKSNEREQSFTELKNLFFSMYINYSLYGMDSDDFIDESVVLDLNLQENISDEISWLDSIFHKNDGYQTPVVIHPYRNDAQINVRNEKELLNQRLVSLIITEKDYVQLSDKILFKKLKLNSIRKGLINAKVNEILNDDYSETNYLNKNLRLLKATDLNSDEILANQLDNIFKLTKSCSNLDSRYNILDKINDDFTNDFELYHYFLLHIVPDANYSEEQLKNINFRNKIELEIINSYENDVQIMLKYLFNFFSKLNLYQYNKILVLDIYYDFWLKELKNHEPINDEFEKALFEYIVVKSYKTIRYPKYQIFNSADSLQDFETKIKLSDKVVNNHEDFLVKLNNDVSHISTKLNQAITIFNIKNKAPELYNFYKNMFTQSDSIIDANTLDIESLRHVVKNSINKTNKEPIYLIPPPIFNLEVKVSSDKSEDLHSIKKLSSGEFQFITMISSIIYHLKNLDSVEEDYYQGRVRKEYQFQYKNVSIILDEIELYFHPEFQRDFIFQIIERLKNLTFKSIQSISFLFITHSPFILSDIPSQNVLKIDKGFPKLKDEFNSFGANIYDLLKDEFFMNGHYIGKFSFDKLENIIKQITNNKINRDTEKIVDLIGEPLLKNKLKEMILPLLGSNKIILEKQKMIEELQNQINKLKFESE